MGKSKLNKNENIEMIERKTVGVRVKASKRERDRASTRERS
jgi:hypothetical protein